jgi:hypothetical protein
MRSEVKKRDKTEAETGTHAKTKISKILLDILKRVFNNMIHLTGVLFERR